MHQVMKCFMVALCAQRKEQGYKTEQWDILIPSVQYAINTQKKGPQKISPVKYLLGREPRDISSLSFENIYENVKT